MCEKVDVGGLYVLRDLGWRREEHGRPEILYAGQDLLALGVQWTKGVLLDPLWIEKILAMCSCFGGCENSRTLIKLHIRKLALELR